MRKFEIAIHSFSPLVYITPKEIIYLTSSTKTGLYLIETW